ncbi:MAG: toprim domain-containing protein, partial [Planctomycetales bacterium]|nr:toprim domain-containing protein [Planctomycetales bacterium]
VIMAHQHGLSNVVAVCGTALGEQHLKLIQRMTDSVALVLDGDAAGQRRASDVLEMFLENQIDLRILTLPENLDPCDFIATPKEGRGVDALRELLKRAPDALEHKLETVTNGLVSPENTHAASRAAEEVLATLARAARSGMAGSAVMLREQSILSRLSTKLRLPVDQLRTRLSAIRQEQARKPLTHAHEQHDAPPEAHAEFSPVADKLTACDQELLELMLLDHECARRIVESIPPEHVQSEIGRSLFFAFRDALEVHGEVEFQWLMNSLTDERLKSKKVTIDEAREAKIEGDRQQRLADLIARQRQINERAERSQHKAALAGKSLNETQEEEALKNIFATLKNRQTGSSPTEG